MKRIIILCLIITFMSGCSKEQIVTGPVKDPVTKYFETFHHDMAETVKVIAEQELVKNLTHLQRMNYGGNKYYPLEREALTKMIRSLSSYPYAECILANASGMIIYSMVEDRFFSHNTEGFRTNIAPAFTQARTGNPYIVDVAEYPAKSGVFRLWYAMPVFRHGKVEGVLIAAMDTVEIQKATGVKGEILDAQGYIRVSCDLTRMVQNVNDELVSQIKAENLPPSWIKVSHYNLAWYFDGSVK